MISWEEVHEAHEPKLVGNKRLITQIKQFKGLYFKCI